jgi:hypothetical protein
MLLQNQTEPLTLEYIALIARGNENVASTSVFAESDIDASASAKEWASSLNFALDDDVCLLLKKPDGTFIAYLREDF